MEAPEIGRPNPPSTASAFGVAKIMNPSAAISLTILNLAIMSRSLVVFVLALAPNSRTRRTTTLSIRMSPYLHPLRSASRLVCLDGATRQQLVERPVHCALLISGGERRNDFEGRRGARATNFPQSKIEIRKSR